MARRGAVPGPIRAINETSHSVDTQQWTAQTNTHVIRSVLHGPCCWLGYCVGAISTPISNHCRLLTTKYSMQQTHGVLPACTVQTDHKLCRLICPFMYDIDGIVQP